MDIIKAKNIDGKHLELEQGIGIEDKEVFIKVIRKGVVESVKGVLGIRCG